MRFGYIRVSTNKQEYFRQQDALKSEHLDKVIEEKVSGRSRKRVGLEQLLENVRPKDEIIVESISRLGRNTLDILQIIEELEGKGVRFKSIKENIDTSTPTGKAMFQMMAVIAQLERDLTIQRVNEGLAAAVKRGKVLGRPAKPKKDIDHAIYLYESERYPLPEIQHLSGVSKSLMYKELKKRRDSK